MKNKHYLLLLIAIVMASCSADDITENPDPVENELTLQRVVTYQPSKEFYDNSTTALWAAKTVQYFEDGLIVADSTFNKVHDLESVTVRTARATSASEITYNRDNIAENTILYTYDGNGRVTELSVSSPSVNYAKTVVYTATGSATVTYHDPVSGSSQVLGTYMPNENGILSNFNAANENESLVFQDNKPITYIQTTMGSFTTINMEYYDVPVPANRLKTATQINNITLTGTLLESVANNSDHYLKSIHNVYSYSHTFNSLNYIEHSMFYDLIDLRTVETFYYYNE